MVGRQCLKLRGHRPSTGGRTGAIEDKRKEPLEFYEGNQGRVAGGLKDAAGRCHGSKGEQMTVGRRRSKGTEFSRGAASRARGGGVRRESEEAVEGQRRCLGSRGDTSLVTESRLLPGMEVLSLVRCT